MSAVIYRCVRKNPVRKPKAEKKPAKKAAKDAPKAEKTPAKKAAKAEKAPAKPKKAARTKA